ncbi:MAG: hypothetical protein JWO30_1673 [Fibrobacteres bacterium]|nr:hypothetical protein [Fibrobacterota bacterium]
MSKARYFAAAFLIIAGLLPGSAAAHPSGVSRVDMIVRQDTLEGRVDVNRDDLFYALEFKSLRETPKSEYGSMADRIAYYYQTRLDVKFDGRAADTKVLQYKKHDGNLAAKMDSTDLGDTTIALRLAWAIPKGAKRLEMGSKLFAELEVQPLCHLRIEYKGVEIKRKFLGLDDRVSLPMEPDSLEALRAAAEKPAVAAGSATPSEPEEESVVGRFLWLGFTHILPEGTDHILFVLGLFFFSVMLRPLLIQVTAFTVAHSITLGLSLLGVFSLSSRIVEPLIALSIVVVAVENIFFRKLRPSRFLIVFGFGLVHGLGFAGVLKSLGLPEGQFFKVLVSFNVGVELGQLTVIAAASALTMWMWKKPWYHRRVVIPVSALIAGVGLFWFIQRLSMVSG